MCAFSQNDLPIHAVLKKTFFEVTFMAQQMDYRGFTITLKGIFRKNQFGRSEDFIQGKFRIKMNGKREIFTFIHKSVEPILLKFKLLVDYYHDGESMNDIDFHYRGFVCYLRIVTTKDAFNKDFRTFVGLYDMYEARSIVKIRSEHHELEPILLRFKILADAYHESLK